MHTQGKFEHTPKGYLEAKDWLTYVVEWENITMTDPSFAPEYKKFLECCCHLLGWDKEEVHNMKCTNFWLFGFMEDFKTPKEAVEVFRAKKKEFGNDFPPKPEILTLSARDSRQLLDNLEILGKEKLIMKYEAEVEKEWSDEVRDAHEEENVDFYLMQFKLNLERLDRLEREAKEMWKMYKYDKTVDSIAYMKIVLSCIKHRSKLLGLLDTKTTRK